MDRTVERCCSNEERAEWVSTQARDGAVASGFSRRRSHSRSDIQRRHGGTYRLRQAEGILWERSSWLLVCLSQLRARHPEALDSLGVIELNPSWTHRLQCLICASFTTRRQEHHCLSKSPSQPNRQSPRLNPKRQELLGLENGPEWMRTLSQSQCKNPSSPAAERNEGLRSLGSGVEEPSADHDVSSACAAQP